MPTNLPLAIYIAESNHSDMSYSSLLKQLIEECDLRHLDVRVFSEYESQTCKVNGMTHMANGNIEAALDGVPTDPSEQLEKLENAPSKEVHIATTEFLDGRLIPMGGVKKRWRELVPQTWEELSPAIQAGTPAELLGHFKEREAIDDSAILQKMEESVAKGEYADAKTYYDYWGACLNYTLIHQGMAQDVRNNLVNQPAPDVVIMVVGKAHLQGLKKQLPEFVGLQTIVVRGDKTDVIGEVEFDFDEILREARVPALVTKSLRLRTSFFEAEKLLHESSPTQLEIGKFVGEFDSAGRPTYGVLKVEKCDFLPKETFVGKFGEDGLPLEGEIRGPGFHTKLKTKKDGSRHFTQKNLEGGMVIDWDWRDGKNENQRCVGISGDLLDGPLVVRKFNEAEVSAAEIYLPSVTEIGQKFSLVRKAFEDLREGNREKHPEGFQGLKDALAAREIFYSDTMFSELVGMRSEQDQRDKAVVEGGVRVKRGSRKNPMSEEEKSKFGNCREYGAQTQKIAIEQGLPHTFTLFGNPDHVFNIAVLEDKMIAIDGWNGDSIYEFSPKEFYQNQSLHAIFGLSVHRDNWFDAEKNPRGLLSREDSSTVAAKDSLEARIHEISEARFDPEIQEIIQGRVAAKLSQLDPNDAYYHENASELKSIINHFGLDPKLSKQMKKDYFAKFDPERLVVGNEAYVIYDLFCRDAENPSKELENLRKEFVPRIQQSSAAKSDRGKALISGFDKVFDKVSIEALDLAEPQKPSSSPKKTDFEKLAQARGSKFNEV